MLLKNFPQDVAEQTEAQEKLKQRNIGSAKNSAFHVK
jgi:hypothetical protein